MKKIYIALAAAAVCFASCNKEVVVTPVNEDVDSHLVQMTFTASTAETKTTLGTLSGTMYPVIWSNDDAIKVIAVDGDGATLYTDTFTIDAGGSSSATFTGTTYADAAAYYAVYPASFSATVSGKGDAATIALNDYYSHNVTAFEGGFDPSRVLMFAVSDNGSFSFKHGVSFFKITISEDDIKSVEFRVPSSDNSARIYGNPTFKVSDGTTTSFANGSSTNNYITLAPTSGTLTKGATYYVPFVAKNASLSTYLQLTYTNTADVTESKKTTKLNGKFTNGTVYDLGTPPISFNPRFSASNVTIEADNEAGTIDFTVSNLVDGGVVTKEVLAGATIPNFSLGAVSFNTTTGVGAINFTCDKNTDTDNPKTATVRLTYTYNTDQTVTKDVTITQKKKGATVISYAWDFSSSAFSEANNAASTVLSSTASASSNTSITWDYLGVDLTYIANKSTYNGTYIQTGGNGSATSRSFSFTAPAAGTLTISASSNGSSSRALTVTLDGTAVTASSGGTVTSTTPNSHVYSLTTGGTVVIYSSAGQVRFYTISYNNN